MPPTPSRWPSATCTAPPLKGGQSPREVFDDCPSHGKSFDLERRFPHLGRGRRGLRGLSLGEQPGKAQTPPEPRRDFDLDLHRRPRGQHHPLRIFKPPRKAAFLKAHLRL